MVAIRRNHTLRINGITIKCRQHLFVVLSQEPCSCTVLIDRITIAGHNLSELRVMAVSCITLFALVLPVVSRQSHVRTIRFFHVLFLLPHRRSGEDYDYFFYFTLLLFHNNLCPKCKKRCCVCNAAGTSTSMLVTRLAVAKCRIIGFERHFGQSLSTPKTFSKLRNALLPVCCLCSVQITRTPGDSVGAGLTTNAREHFSCDSTRVRVVQHNLTPKLQQLCTTCTITLASTRIRQHTST